MSKEKQSKLDAHTERLEHWFGTEKKTLDEVREQLLLDGVSVSCSRLSDWWSARQTQLQQKAVLSQITSGARQCQDVEAALGKNGAPGMDTLIKLHRVLIFKLSMQSNVDSEQIKLVNGMMREVIRFTRLEQLKEQLALDRDRFQFDAAKACLAQLPTLKTISADKSLSQTEKVQQIRLKLFGVAAD